MFPLYVYILISLLLKVGMIRTDKTLFGASALVQMSLVKFGQSVKPLATVGTQVGKHSQLVVDTGGGGSVNL
jgi:hypothetical protein